MKKELSLLEQIITMNALTGSMKMCDLLEKNDPENELLIILKEKIKKLKIELNIDIKKQP